MTKVTNYPFCKLPNTHPDNYFLSKCILAKKYGYTHPYDQTSDDTRGNFKKKQAQRKKTADADKKDANDLKKAENDRKARADCEKADAEKARLAAAAATAAAAAATAAVTAGDIVVGKGGKDAVTEKKG